MAGRWWHLGRTDGRESGRTAGDGRWRRATRPAPFRNIGLWSLWDWKSDLHWGHLDGANVCNYSRHGWSGFLPSLLEFVLASCLLFFAVHADGSLLMLIPSGENTRALEGSTAESGVLDLRCRMSSISDPFLVHALEDDMASYICAVTSLKTEPISVP